MSAGVMANGNEINQMIMASESYRKLRNVQPMANGVSDYSIESQKAIQCVNTVSLFFK
jgi:hypothetical protein